MEHNLEEGDVVLCTVERIMGTVVSVKIHPSESNKSELEGSIITAEIAPGRIRNLREYVVPKKMIVCKIIRISPDRRHIDLSLRRVTGKERKEVMDNYKAEKNSESILKGILKEKAEPIIEKIREKSSLLEFLEKSKTDSKELEKLAGKENTSKIIEVIKKQKIKEKAIKKEISLRSSKPNGLETIKKILLVNNKAIEIKYLAPGRYTLKIISSDFKKANSEMQSILEEMESKAKKEDAEFSVKDIKNK